MLLFAITKNRGSQVGFPTWKNGCDCLIEDPMFLIPNVYFYLKSGIIAAAKISWLGDWLQIHF